MISPLGNLDHGFINVERADSWVRGFAQKKGDHYSGYSMLLVNLHSKYLGEL